MWASVLAALALSAGCGGKTTETHQASGAAHSKGLIAFYSIAPAGIYAITPAGEIRRITGPDFDEDPAWSPNGRLLVFVRTGETRRGIAERTFYVVNPDGSGLTRLTGSYAVDGEPVWSPREDRIAFARYVGDEVYDLHVMDTRSGVTRRLARGNRATWSPDGKRLAFTRHSGDRGCAVYVVRADGTGERRLTAGTAPAWSPDGRKIAFASPCIDSVTQRIYVISPDGAARRELTRGGAPVWSPDGTRIAFTRTVKGREESDLFVMSLDGSGKHRLTRNHERESAPTWSQDGKEIAYAQTQCCGSLPGWDIYVVKADGTFTRRLTTGSPGYVNIGPVWQPAAQQSRTP